MLHLPLVVARQFGYGRSNRYSNENRLGGTGAVVDFLDVRGEEA